MATSHLHSKQQSGLASTLQDLKVLTHVLVIPGILAAMFGFYGMLYWIVPAVAYCTFAKEKQDERIFFLFLVVITLAIMAVGWADSVPTPS